MANTAPGASRLEMLVDDALAGVLTMDLPLAKLNVEPFLLDLARASKAMHRRVRAVNLEAFDLVVELERQTRLLAEQFEHVGQCGCGTQLYVVRTYTYPGFGVFPVTQNQLDRGIANAGDDEEREALQILQGRRSEAPPYIGGASAAQEDHLELQGKRGYLCADCYAEDYGDLDASTTVNRMRTKGRFQGWLTSVTSAAGILGWRAATSWTTARTAAMGSSSSKVHTMDPPRGSEAPTTSSCHPDRRVDF